MAGRRSRIFKGLTQKEAGFTKAVIKQIVKGEEINATQAALESYDAKSPKVAQSIGSELLSKPIIKKTIEEALVAKGITFETVLENFGKIASHTPEKISAEAVLRANVEMMKLLNGYPGKKTTKVSLNMYGNVKDMNFSEAKEAYKGLNGETDDFIQEAEGF